VILFIKFYGNVWNVFSSVDIFPDDIPKHRFTEISERTLISV
jgi:hypothetical protein